MTSTEVIELLYKAMPNNKNIGNLDIKDSYLYFSWYGHRFRVGNNLSVEESNDGLLLYNSMANLIEHILKTYKNNQ